MAQPLWEKLWWFLKKIKKELPYNLAIPLLGIYVMETKKRILKDVYTLMFNAAPFTAVKLLKQPKWPLVSDWINKMPYINIMEYDSTIRKKNILPFATTWMEQARYDKWKNSERERQVLCDITYIWNFNKLNL